MIGWWIPQLALVGAEVALAGSVAEVEGSGVLDPCLADGDCAAEFGELAADTLRAAAMSAEGMGIGLSPAMVRGSGLGLELSIQSLAIPPGVAPDGADMAPAIPRLALGGFGGNRVRVGGGIEGGAALPTDGYDLGFTVGGRMGFVVGSPDQRRWVGFEVDGGYAVVEGVLFDDPGRAAVAVPAPVALAVPACPILPCVDAMRMIHAGIDTVLSYDIDPTAVLLLRLGGVFETETFDVALDGTRWSSSGILPRATLGAAYRPNPRAWVAAAVRATLLEASETSTRSRVPWLASLSIGWRFGPELVGAVVAEPVVVPQPRTVPVPNIEVRPHPDLECGPNALPTGLPPPFGLEGWCVAITEDGRVIQEGPHVRWHTPEQIAESGSYTANLRSGTWTVYDPSGALLSHGTYVDGLKEGMWRTYYPTGDRRSEGKYEHGAETGQWILWGEDGNSETVGEYWNGQRTGIWRDYVGGVRVRERTFREGLLMTDEQYLPE